MTNRPPARRRWTQFSLRSFLLITTLSAIGLSYYYGSFRSIADDCYVPPDFGPPIWIAPPKKSEVIRKFLERNPEFVSTPGRLYVVKEKLADHLDSPQYSLVGKVRLHHVRFRCTVYSSATSSKRPVDVIIIDRNHYHTKWGESANVRRRFGDQTPQQAP